MKTNNEFNYMVKTNSVWTSSDMNIFIVSKIQKKAGKTWIFYHSLQNKNKKYSCYEEAFIQRFGIFNNLFT